jgi:hypothetical protein
MLQTTAIPLAPREPRRLFEQRAKSAEAKATFALPLWLWISTAALAIWGSFSANPILTPAAILVLTACIQLLWRRGEPPVLAFACAMQWIQASAVIFYTDFYKVSVEQAGGGPELETATWLSLAAVVVLTLGMRVALIRCRRSQHAGLSAEAFRVNIANAFIFYLVSFAIATFAGRIGFQVPGFTQIIFALMALKWTAVFLLAYCVIEQRVGYIFLAIAIILELSIGLLSFFSGFKSIFFILLVVALASPLAFRGRRLAITLATVLALFFFGVVWSAIKGDYREFLNEGTGEQEVYVSVEQRVDKLSDLITGFTWDNFMDGLDAMVLRVSYVRFFALTLMNVPESVPYEHGALWLGALKHVVTPRLFFPGKAIISDSDRTMLYTGVRVASEEQGTSIGIGYVAESYVDFGPIGMFAPIFLLGIFYGLIYRLFVIRSRSKLICTAIASAILIFGAYTIETSNIKIVGGIVTALLVNGMIYLLFGRVFRAWLEQRQD